MLKDPDLKAFLQEREIEVLQGLSMSSPRNRTIVVRRCAYYGFLQVCEKRDPTVRPPPEIPEEGRGRERHPGESPGENLTNEELE